MSDLVERWAKRAENGEFCRPIPCPTADCPSNIIMDLCAELVTARRLLTEGIAQTEKYLPLIEGRVVAPHGLSSRDARAFLDAARAALAQPEETAGRSEPVHTKGAPRLEPSDSYRGGNAMRKRRSAQPEETAG